jgi:hypothetical protein
MLQMEPAYAVPTEEGKTNWKKGMTKHCMMRDQTYPEYKACLADMHYQEKRAERECKKATNDYKAARKQAQQVYYNAKKAAKAKSRNACSSATSDAGRKIRKDEECLKQVTKVMNMSHATIYQTLAFEQCARQCGENYWCMDEHPCQPKVDMASVATETMQDTANYQKYEFWSSCFAGCNAAYIYSKDGADMKPCKEVGCPRQALDVTPYCLDGCDVYYSLLFAYTPSQNLPGDVPPSEASPSQQLEAIRRLNVEAPELDDDEWADREELMQELRAMRFEVTRLRAELHSTKVECMKGGD